MVSLLRNLISPNVADVYAGNEGGKQAGSFQMSHSGSCEQIMERRGHRPAASTGRIRRTGESGFQLLVSENGRAKIMSRGKPSRIPLPVAEAVIEKGPLPRGDRQQEAGRLVGADNAECAPDTCQPELALPPGEALRLLGQMSRKYGFTAPLALPQLGDDD